MLLRVLKIASYEHKAGVCEALRFIHTHEGLPNVMLVRATTLAQLSGERHMPTCQNEAEKAFIQAALYLVVVLQVLDKTMFSLLMVMYLDGDQDVRYALSQCCRKKRIQTTYIQNNFRNFYRFR